MTSKYRPDLGEEAELVVVEVIKNFIGNKVDFKYSRRITHFIHAKKSDTLDQNGVDILVVFDTFLALPLQIKKSISCGRGKHLAKHPNINYVFGVGELPKSDKDSASYHKISQRLTKLINQALTHHNNNPS